MVASVPITPRLTSIHATAGCSAACYSACAASSAILCSTYVCCCHFGKARRPHGCLLMLSAVQRLAYANPQLWLQQNQSHNTNPVQTYTRRRAWLSSLACLPAALAVGSCQPCQSQGHRLPQTLCYTRKPIVIVYTLQSSCTQRAAQAMPA